MAGRRDGALRSRLEQWAHVAQVAGSIAAAIAVIVGFWQFRVQLQQSAETDRISTLEQLYARMHDIDKLFVEKPELKPYFYQGMKKSDANPLVAADNMPRVRAQVDAMAELLCDFFAAALESMKALSPGTYREWESYVADIFKNSPTLREFYCTRREWYVGKEIQRVFTAAESELGERNCLGTDAAK